VRSYNVSSRTRSTVDVLGEEGVANLDLVGDFTTGPATHKLLLYSVYQRSLSKELGFVFDLRRINVAITRAREWLSLSAHQKVTKQSVKPSPYIEKILEIYDDTKDFPPDWSEPNSVQDSEILQITYSEIADYLSCGWSYWLKSRIGFPAAVVEEIGYGRAVHHLMRAIAEETARKGKPLGPMEVDKLIATDFFLPFATSAIAARYKESARKLAFSYLKEYSEEMNRVWETERPFELAIEGALITGRADVILEKHEGVPDDLAIIDYKTGTEGQEFDLQLQIYAEAGFREGLSVRGAFVHDLGDKKRIEVDTSESARAAFKTPLAKRELVGLGAGRG
jgi:DNA helicase-2/ATP-dependent DNA helicase PcrA